ncbi:MAG: hypothetical protein UD961_16160 [Bacteroidales bacterium]|nr:hypothetical protein [Bacteroidales bacterium]
MNRHIYRLVAAVLAAITIVSCYDARKSETFRLLEDVDSYIEARPDSALAVLEGIDKEALKNKELEAKYEFLLWNVNLKMSLPIPDIKSTRTAYDYYTRREASAERFMCHLYRGIYYLAQNDSENAMLEFSKADEDYELVSYGMQGLLHTYKGIVYHLYFDFDNQISQFEAAADRYLKGNILSRYVESVVQIMDGYIMQDDAANCSRYINLAEDYMEYADEETQHHFYISKAKYLQCINKTEELLELLDEYLKTMPDSPYMNWRILAYMYNSTGANDKALFCIEKEAEVNDISEDQNYYAVLAGIKEGLKDYKGAIAAHKISTRIDDSLEVINLNQHVQLIEERHSNEMSRIEAENTKRIALLIAVIVILIAFIFIYFIRRQLRIRTAEKKQLEIEKQRYEQLYADAVAERDALTKMIEDSSVKDETKAVIRERLEILNKVIISHITDTSSANKKAFQELEALISDRDSFIESTRLTIEGNNPGFITALKKQGLTDEEINICCLYVIGLKGKDIKAYTSQPRHYNQSADIRHKLGLTENDTNLSIFLREMLEK